jgi:hypothetical protein
LRKKYLRATSGRYGTFLLQLVMPASPICHHSSGTLLGRHCIVLNSVLSRFLTLLAFRVFEKEGIEAAVVEVGVGGRADATNLFSSPALVASGITSLGYDHMNVLGDTLASIAFEKAGIMKENAPAFTVPQLDEPMAVLQERARVVKV